MDQTLSPVVIIVDDEITQLRLMASLLARSYVALPISSAKEALRVLDDMHMTGDLPQVKAVLLDVMMPEIDGLTLLEMIRQRYPIEVPVIMVTALSLKGTILRAQKLGANDYLIKPFPTQLLLDKLAQLGSDGDQEMVDGTQ
ncbi:MAG: response regulator [Caldilineaceae bacterium]